MGEISPCDRRVRLWISVECWREDVLIFLSPIVRRSGALIFLSPNVRRLGALIFLSPNSDRKGPRAVLQGFPVGRSPVISSSSRSFYLELVRFPALSLISAAGLPQLTVNLTRPLAIEGILAGTYAFRLFLLVSQIILISKIPHIMINYTTIPLQSVR